MSNRKGSIYFLAIFLIVVLVLSATFVVALSRSERQQLSECNKECSFLKKADKKVCTENYRFCQDTCKTEHRTCVDEAKENRDLCRDGCEANSENSREKTSCSRECSRIYSDVRRNQCDARSCRGECIDDRKSCKETVKTNHEECRNQCVLANAPTETEETIELTKYNYEVEEETCIEAGGYYQRLCKGPYFRITCSREKYCQCEGVNEYSCPEDLECVKNHGFRIPGRGSSYQNGWRSILGQELGDSGICGKEIVLE